MKNCVEIVALKLLRLFVFLTIPTFLVSSGSIGKTKPAVFSVKGFPLGVGSQWVYVRVDSSSSGFPLEGIAKHVVVETVTVKIVGQTQTGEGRTASIWVREFRSKVDSQQYITLSGVERPPSRERPPKVDTCIQQALTMQNYLAVDTQYVTTIGDTVIFTKRFQVYTDTAKPLYEHELSRFVFPIKAGNSWIGNSYGTLNPGITHNVIQSDSVEVVNGNYRQGFLVEMRNLSVGNAFNNIAYWLVPGVGLVQKENRYEFTLGNQYGVERWKLISYEIKK